MLPQFASPAAARASARSQGNSQAGPRHGHTSRAQQLLGWALVLGPSRAQQLPGWALVLGPRHAGAIVVYKQGRGVPRGLDSGGFAGLTALCLHLHCVASFSS